MFYSSKSDYSKNATVGQPTHRVCAHRSIRTRGEHEAVGEQGLEGANTVAWRVTPGQHHGGETPLLEPAFARSAHQSGPKEE